MDATFTDTASTTGRIHLPGIGTVIVDLDKSVLEPRTHVVEQRLTRVARRLVEDLADKRYGEHDWRWNDSNGIPLA